MGPELKKLYRSVLIWEDKVECVQQSYGIGDNLATVFNIYIKDSVRVIRNKVATLVASRDKVWYDRATARAERCNAWK